ncbi:MAG: TolC family protein, partial [Bacteroidales bacterium]|nr:TolC family protein [Bacteroidales bacterium]
MLFSRSMIRKLPCLLLTFILLPAICQGQDNWTLDKCISHAYEKNIILKQQEIQVAMVGNQLKQSKLALLPNLNAGVGQTFRFGRSVDPLTYEFTTQNSQGTSFSASSGIMLFKGLQAYNTIKKNELDLKKNLADLEHAKNNLALSITRHFLQILFKQELLAIAERQVEISKQQLEQTAQLVKAGALAQGNLLEIKAQLASEELNLVITNNQLELSRLDLAQLLDLKNPDDFSISSPNLPDIPMDLITPKVSEIYESSIRFLPRIKSAEFKVKSLEKNLLLAKGELSPSLSMNSYWGTGYSDQIRDQLTGNIMPFRNQTGFSSTSSLNFYLSIPIFNNWNSRTSIKNAQLEVLNSHYSLEISQNQLRKEIQQAYADAKAALDRYHATESSLLSLQEAFRYTEKKFKVGMLTSLDYKEAKNNLTRAQSELLQARYHYIF